MAEKGENQAVSKLFSPIEISGLTIKNRVVMPALILNYPFEGYDIGPEWTRFYHRRAQGGTGMIIVGAVFVDQAGKMDPYQLGADRDEWIPSLSKVAQSIKDGGGVPAIQLNHAGRYSKKKITGVDSVAPSELISRYTKEKPRILTTEEVEDVFQSFADAAVRGKAAGFEAIELLGATGYLISQFLSPLTNHRTDRFGGSEENRWSFAKELITAVKKAIGDDFPLIFRQSSTDNMKGGMDDKDQLRFSKKLEEWGVHLLNVTAGWHDSPIHQIGPSVPHGHYIPYATRIKETVNIPVSCAMRITDPKQAREVIDDGKLDMVTMGRALIADPDWVNKAQAGKDDSIRYCICCCNCFDRAFAKQSVECSINAATDDDTLEPAAVSKRVLVIGAGPAGMEAARVLSKRGHQVTILEKEGRLGGRLPTGARPPHKAEINHLVQFLSHELTEMNVPVVKTVDFETLKDNFDGVVLAAGASEKKIQINGMESVPNYFATQVIDELVTPENPVIVVGAGLVGCETAEFLREKNYDVSIVEIQAKPLPDMGASLRWPLLGRLKKAEINIYTSSSIQEIKDGEAVIQTEEGTVTLKVGSLVFAVGFAAEKRLDETLKGAGVPFCAIGDHKSPRRIRDAIHEGFWAGATWIKELEK